MTELPNRVQNEIRYIGGKIFDILVGLGLGKKIAQKAFNRVVQVMAENFPFFGEIWDFINQAGGQLTGLTNMTLSGRITTNGEASGRTSFSTQSSVEVSLTDKAGIDTKNSNIKIGDLEFEGIKVDTGIGKNKGINKGRIEKIEIESEGSALAKARGNHLAGRSANGMGWAYVNISECLVEHPNHNPDAKDDSNGDGKVDHGDKDVDDWGNDHDGNNDDLVNTVKSTYLSNNIDAGFGLGLGSDLVVDPPEDGEDPEDHVKGYIEANKGKYLDKYDNIGEDEDGNPKTGVKMDRLLSYEIIRLSFYKRWKKLIEKIDPQVDRDNFWKAKKELLDGYERIKKAMDTLKEELKRLENTVQQRNEKFEE